MVGSYRTDDKACLDWARRNQNRKVGANRSSAKLKKGKRPAKRTSSIPHGEDNFRKMCPAGQVASAWETFLVKKVAPAWKIFLEGVIR